MTLRISLIFLASLLFITVLATLSLPADAYGIDPSVENEISSTRMMSTGPLNVIVLSGR